MASKIKKFCKAEVNGVLSIDDDILVLVEDVEEPVNLKEFFEDFCDKEIKISIESKLEM